MIVWSSPVFPLRWTSASAPEPPGLLMGMRGFDDRSCFSTMVCIRRAILSAPPPLPAMITKSIGFFGSQACAAPVTDAIEATLSVTAAAAASTERMGRFISSFSREMVRRPREIRGADGAL